MNTKITILAASLGIAALAGVAYAATDSTPANTPPPAFAEHRGGFQARLAGRLGLSADQQKAVDELREQGRSEIEALRADDSLTPDARREQARAIMQKYRGKFRAVLTPEQQKKADELRAQFRGRTGSFMDRRGPRGRGDEFRGHGQRPGHRQDPMAIIARADRIKDRMAEKLQLTDEQRDQFEHLARAYREEQRAAMKKHREEMRAVLSPEQQQEFDRMQKHMHRGDGGPRPFAGMDGRRHHRMGGEDALPPPPPDTE